MERHKTNDNATREYSSPACSLHEWEAEPVAATAALDICIKRIYADAAPADGYRVLVDRLWPRGIRKETAALDEWLREAAPGTELRKWFGHDPQRWQEFRRRYRAELRARDGALEALRRRAAHGRVTLLYGAKDPRINHAVVLQEFLRGT